MAKKKVGKGEIDLDDFDFDSMDFDIPDFVDPDPSTDDRKPVAKLASGFKEGINSSIASPDLIKRSLGQALPRGYAQAINVYDATADTTRELYHSVTQDLRPVTEGMRAAASKISPKIKAKLPKKLAQKLTDFAEGGFTSSDYSASKLKQESEDSQIAAAIGEMFNAQASRNNDLLAEDKAEEAIRDSLTDKRHKQSVGTMQVVAEGVSRLVGYQDNVLSKYQQKSLELQYRHYFVAKDLLDISNIQNEKMVLAMDKVIKNTALPEAVKIQKSEMASQMLKERMIGAGFKNIGNWTRNYRENLTKNIKDVVGGFTGNIGQAADMGSTMFDSMGAAKGTGYMAGQQVADMLHDFVSSRAAPHLDKMPWLKKTGAKIGNAISNAPRKADRWAKSETKGQGFGSSLIQFMKDVAPKYYLNDEIQSSNIMDSDRPATFDNITRKSIVEIIPGWLSQINRWVKATATGKLDTEEEMDVFNLEKGIFTSRSNYMKDIKKRIMPADEVSAMRTAMDDFINKLDKDGDLGQSTRNALKKKLLSDTVHGKDFDPMSLTKRENYVGMDEDHIDDLRYFFRNKFGIDFDGNNEDDSAEYHDNLGDLQSRFNSFENVLPNSIDYVRNLHQVLGKDNLIKMGLMTRTGNRDAVNIDKVLGDILNEEGLDQLPSNTSDAARNYTINPAFGKLPSQTTTPLPPQATAQVGGTVSDDLFDRYLGRESILIQEVLGLRSDVKANNLRELISINTQTLGEINAKIGLVGNRAGLPSPDKSPSAAGFKEWAKLTYKGGKATLGGAGSRIGAVGRSYLGMVGEFYKGLGIAGMWAGGKGIDGAIGSAKLLFKKGKTKAIYLKGQATAIIDEQMLKSKSLRDVNTGKLITTVKDITGPVVDRFNKEVLSAKDYAEGLYDERGRSIVATVTSWVGSAASGYGRLVAGGYSGAFNGAKSIVQGLYGAVQDQMDLYLKGESIPRLRKTLMEAGEYYDKVTGDPIRKISDIKGDIVDKLGNIIVSAKDIEKSHGFFDHAGKAIKVGAGGLFEIGKFAGNVAIGYGKAVLGAYSLAWKGVKRIFGGKGKKGGGMSGVVDEDMLTVGYHQLSIQEKMYDFMRKTWGKGKFDTDGDGDRDGSVADLLAKRKEKKDAAALANGGDPSKNPGFLKNLGGMLGGLFKRKNKDGDDEDDESSWLSDASDVAEIADFANGDGGGRPKRGRKRGLGGKLKGLLKGGGKLLGLAGTAYAGYSAYDSFSKGNYGDAALDAGMAAGGAALSFGGLSALGGALAGIGSILASPVVLGAAAIGGVGYGAYKLYKFVANKPTPLRAVRFAQYGINVRDEDEVAAIMGLEAMMLKNITYSESDPAKVNANGIDPAALVTLFGIDPNNTDQIDRAVNLNKWLAARFMPVFTAHATALNKLASGVKLENVDEKLPIAQGLDYIKAVRADELKSVYDMLEPSPFDDELSSDAGDVEDWVEDAIAFYEKKAKDTPPPETSTINKTMAKVEADIAAATVIGSNVADLKGRKGNTDGASNISDFTEGVLDQAKTGALITAVGLGGLFGGWKAVSAIKGHLFPNKKRPKVTLDALTAARYKIYGLTDLDLGKVESLYNLEDAMWKDVKYDSDKQAFYDGVPETIYPIVKQYFNVNDSDTERRTQWFVWFKYRFLPVFVQFCTSVRAAQSIDARDASSKLTLNEQHEVLTQTNITKSDYNGMSQSVWMVDASPWHRHVMNKDESTIAENLEALKTAGKRANYGERSTGVTNPINEIEMARRQEQMDKDGNFSAAGSENDESPGFFSKTMSTIFGTKGADNKRTGGWLGGDISGKDLTNGTAAPLTGGATIQDHPGGGTGGDINTIPMPTGKGWAGSKETILAAAKMAGFDPHIAATVAALESRFDPGARPITRDGRLLSSAGGYYQFIDSTWTAMLKKYGRKYGLAANASKFDGRANALMGMEFLKENATYLKNKLGRSITDVDLYAAHFLGPGGANRFLSANPGADARSAVASNVPGSNPSVFFAGGRARTVSEVYKELDKRMVTSRNLHDVKPGFKFESEAVTTGGAPVKDSGGSGWVDVGLMSDSSAVDAASSGAGVEVGSGDKTTGGATRASVAVSEGKATAAAQGVQSTSTTGLTKPGEAMDERAGTPSVQAAIAQKQASVETGSLTESMSVVSEIMSKQLGVQTSMDVKLGFIVEILKEKGAVGRNETAPLKSSNQQTQSTPPPSKSLGKVPVGMDRKMS